VLDELTRIYTDVFEGRGDTSAITRAVDRVDRLLQADPAAQGESRADYERVLVVEALAVTFEVFEEELTVLVLRVVYHTPR
jgi:hypothetical protein